MNRKLIIVEGPDRTGKTTLAKHLASKFNMFYVKLTAGGPLNSAMPEYHTVTLDFIQWNIEQRAQGVVLDRCWLSEMIYAGLLRPEDAKRFPYKQHEERIALMGGLYLVCDSRTCVERHEKLKDPGHPYTQDQFHLIVEAYREFMSTKPVDVLHWMGVDMDKYIHDLDRFSNLLVDFP